jgi:hypothetical protein
MPFHARRTLLLLLVAVWSILCHSDSPDHEATQGLIITYKTALAHRIELREYMLSKGIAHLRELQQKGVVNSYQILFNRYVDNETWDMMLIASFSKPADLVRWREVELRSPAALSGRRLADVQVVTTTPVARVRSVAPRQSSHDPVFLVIPYKVLVPMTDYIKYFDGYVAPQLDGWRDENVFLGFDLYTAQYPAGRAWASMLVLRYADDASLADRERIVSKVRDRLRNDPSWKAFSDNKGSIRSEQEAVVADEFQTEK